MTEETKIIIREALVRQERFYRGTAESERIDAIHCRRSGDPVIRARADNLDERAAGCDKKADAYKVALRDFENAELRRAPAPPMNPEPPIS